MFEVDVNDRNQETISITASSDAPLPKISILTLDGKEASTVRIGDRLTFKIEIPDNTPYGIFARSCVAMAKDARSTFEIIDEHGCPVDHTIFPNFVPVANGNALESSYEAFRFTESYGVIFQCNVKYCIGKCEPVSSREASGLLQLVGRKFGVNVELLGGANSIISLMPFVLVRVARLRRRNRVACQICAPATTSSPLLANIIGLCARLGQLAAKTSATIKPSLACAGISSPAPSIIGVLFRRRRSAAAFLTQFRALSCCTRLGAKLSLRKRVVIERSCDTREREREAAEQKQRVENWARAQCNRFCRPPPTQRSDCRWPFVGPFAAAAL